MFAIIRFFYCFCNYPGSTVNIHLYWIVMIASPIDFLRALIFVPPRILDSVDAELQYIVILDRVITGLLGHPVAWNIDNQIILIKISTFIIMWVSYSLSFTHLIIEFYIYFRCYLYINNSKILKKDNEYYSFFSSQFRQSTIQQRIIHFATVSCNRRTDETITMIKSALIFTNCSNIHFHIFVDRTSHDEIDRAVSIFFSTKRYCKRGYSGWG